LAVRPDAAGADEIVDERAAEERPAERGEVRLGDPRHVLGADDGKVQPERQVFRDIVREFEVLREERIEIPGGGRRDAEGKEARELRHVKRTEESGEEE